VKYTERARWEAARLAGGRAGTRAGRRGGTWGDLWEHGGKLARAYARRYAPAGSHREYARLVLSYGRAYLDMAGADQLDAPGRW
jgi:hypothetical protein